MRSHVISTLRPQDIEITSNEVIIAENITPYEQEIDGHSIIGFEYDTITYTISEYMIYLNTKNKELEEELRAAKILLGVE